jgi:hypothetical protein
MTSQDENRYDNNNNRDIDPNGQLNYMENTNYFAQSNHEEVNDIDPPPPGTSTLDIEDQSRDEEFAAEAMTANDIRGFEDRETNMQEGDVEAGWGWAAIILSLIALFNIWPLVMGIAGIVVGVMAKRRGADTLGNIAVVAGIAAIVIHLIIDMFV